MAGPNLSTSRTGGSTGHLSDTNAVHGVVNKFDKDATPVSGDTLVWNGTVYVPSAATFRLVSRDEDIEAHGATTAAANNATAIQAALDAAALNGCKAVIPNKGWYTVSDTIFVPDRTTLIGGGRDEHGLKASATFPTDGRPLVRLGRTADSLIFGCRLEETQLDCNSRAAVGIYSSAANEQCKVRHVVLKGFTGTGVHWYQCSGVSLEDSEIYPQAGGATKGVYLQNCALDNMLRRVTVGVNGLLAQGVHIYFSQVIGVGVHVENCTVGIDCDQEAQAALVGISAGSVINNTPTMIRRRSNCTSLAVLNSSRNTSPINIRDDYYALNITDPYIPFYTSNRAIIGDIRHLDGTAGFYGATPVARPTVSGSRGGNAALTDLLAELATMGLITNSSSA